MLGTFCPRAVDPIPKSHVKKQYHTIPVLPQLKEFISTSGLDASTVHKLGLSQCRSPAAHGFVLCFCSSNTLVMGYVVSNKQVYYAQ